MLNDGGRPARLATAPTVINDLPEGARMGGRADAPTTTSAIRRGEKNWSQLLCAGAHY